MPAEQTTVLAYSLRLNKTLKGNKKIKEKIGLKVAWNFTS